MHYNHPDPESVAACSVQCVQLLLWDPVKFMSFAVGAFSLLAQHKWRVPFADGAQTSPMPGNTFSLERQMGLWIQLVPFLFLWQYFCKTSTPMCYSSWRVLVKGICLTFQNLCLLLGLIVEWVVQSETSLLKPNWLFLVLHHWKRDDGQHQGCSWNQYWDLLLSSCSEYKK